MKESILKNKSFRFAIDSVNEYLNLKNQREYVLSKQFLRSSTSIGANIREANNTNSIKDFIYKLNISQKECDETMYWLELMHETKLINKENFTHLHSNASEILKMIKSSINTVKTKHNL
jgi:four helix bundle protein